MLQRQQIVVANAIERQKASLHTCILSKNALVITADYLESRNIIREVLLL